MAKDGPNHSALPLSQLWQLPLLLASIVLLLVGFMLALPGEAPFSADTALDNVQKSVAAGAYKKALEGLREIAVSQHELTEKQQARFHLLRADALYLAGRAAGAEAERTRELIVNSYRTAESLGARLDTDRLSYLTNSLIALGQLGAALEMISAFEDDASDVRLRLLRRITSAMAESPEHDDEKVMQLLSQIQGDPDATRDDEIWTVARQAEMLMQRGEADAAVDQLVRHLAMLQADSDEGLSELRVLLGRAYLAEGDHQTAERLLQRAQQDLDASDPLNADVLVGLGRIRFAEDNIVEAVAHFDKVTTKYVGTSAYLEALIGKAESEARLGAFGDALADYALAVKTVERAGAGDGEITRELASSLEGQYDLRFAQGDYERALRFIELIDPVLGEALPPNLILKRALAHERLARKKLGLDESDAVRGPVDLDKVDSATRAEAQRQYNLAAEAFLAHARALMIADDTAFGQSLWKAADSYDNAGERKKAIELFAEFIKGRPGDPNQLAAQYRLARAYQADGQFAAAVDLYQRLIDQHPRSGEAYASLVPLARCHVTMGHVDQAEHVLRTVVTDHPALRPESSEYHDALIELGRLYYQRGDEGDYEKSIFRLEEAVKRYVDDPQMPELKFMLADAYRKSARQILEKLKEPLTPSQKAAMRTERTRRLEAALQGFDAVISAYDAVDPAKLGEVQEVYLRNSYFYRADCAYELGRYEGPDGAIALYRKAVQRYEKKPAALVALIQIVNSHCELGQFDEARIVNKKAKWYLHRIPAEAFDDPSLPMGREHWQRWLEWTGELALVEASAEAETEAQAGSP